MKNNDNNKVGYGRPPKHTQFSKGQSGNPNGRPKKTKLTQELLNKHLETEIMINGKKITKAEAFIMSLVNDGIKGIPSARNLLISLLPNKSDEIEDFDPGLDDQTALLRFFQKEEAAKRRKKSKP